MATQSSWAWKLRWEERWHFDICRTPWKLWDLHSRLASWHRRSWRDTRLSGPSRSRHQVIRFSPSTNMKGRTSIVGLKLTEDKEELLESNITWLKEEISWSHEEELEAWQCQWYCFRNHDCSQMTKILNGHNYWDVKLSMCFGQKRHRGGISFHTLVVWRWVLCISRNRKEI